MSGTLYLTSNNAVALFIDDATGNISVGSSNNPVSSALYVRGSINTECNVFINGSITTQGGITTCNSVYLGNSNDPATAPSFSWRQQSNVGMYLAAPQTIGFSTTGVERARIDGTQVQLNSNVRLTLQAPGGLGQFIAASNRNVGINTSNPTDTLTVLGTMSATSNLTCSNATLCNVFSCNLSCSNLTSFSNATFGGGATISSWSLGGSWFNLPTTGPSGIGTGGPGANPFVAYVNGNGSWFINSLPGDSAYRNTAGRLLFGNTTGQAAAAFSNNAFQVFGTQSNFNDASFSSNLVCAGTIAEQGSNLVTRYAVSNVGVVASFGSNLAVATSNYTYDILSSRSNLDLTGLGGDGSTIDVSFLTFPTRTGGPAVIMRTIDSNFSADVAFLIASAGSAANVATERMRLRQDGGLVVQGGISECNVALVSRYASLSNFNVLSNALFVNPVTSGRMLNFRVLTSGTTYTPTPGTSNVMLTVLGGGGGGGGALTATRYAGGGGAGGYGRVLVSNVVSTTTYSYSIGAGGTSASNIAGTTGGTTSITIAGNTFSASGGAGGTLANIATAAFGGMGGSNFSGPFTITVPGNPGAGGFQFNQSSGRGADSLFGAGGQERFSCNANAAGFATGLQNARGFGAGGAGGGSSVTNVGFAGGTGTPGLIVVEEFT